MKFLMDMEKCPDCEVVDRSRPKCVLNGTDAFGGRTTSCCTHPWHLTPLCEGDPWLMAIGLPNKINFDGRSIEGMQKRTLDYALRKNIYQIYSKEER